MTSIVIFVIVLIILIIFYIGRCEGFETFNRIRKYDYNVNLTNYKINQKEPLSIIFYDFLDDELFNKIKQEYLNNEDKLVKRLVLNTDILHSDELVNNNMTITKVIHSESVQNKISQKLSEILGETYNFRSNNIYDPYNNFIQTSRYKGEGLNWHYDQKFYGGKTLVGLYTIINEGPNGLSSQDHIQQLNDKVKTLKPPSNSFVLFEASNIYHTATPIKEDEIRVVYQTVYSTEYSQSMFDKLKMLFGTSESLHLANYTMKMGINRLIFT